MIPLNIFAIIGLSVAGVAGATVVFVGGRWAVRKIIGAVRNFQIRRNEVNLQKELAKKTVNPENIQNIVKHLVKLHKSKFARVSPKFFSKNLLGADPRKINPKTRQFIQDYYKEIEKVVKGEKKDIDSKFKTTGKFSRKIPLETATGNTISLDDQSTFIVNEFQYAQKFFAKELENLEIIIDPDTNKKEFINQPRKGGKIINRGQEIYPIVTEVIDNDIVERNKGRTSKLNETILQFSDTSPQRAIKNAQVLFASLFAKAEELEEQGKEPNFTISYYDASTKKKFLKRGEILTQKTFHSSEEIFQFYCDDYMEFLNKKEIGNGEVLGKTLLREDQMDEFNSLRYLRNFNKSNFDKATKSVNELKEKLNEINEMIVEVESKVVESENEYNQAKNIFVAIPANAAAIQAAQNVPQGVAPEDHVFRTTTTEGKLLYKQLEFNRNILTNSKTDKNDLQTKIATALTNLQNIKNGFDTAQKNFESSNKFDYVKNFVKHYKEIKKEISKKKNRQSTL